ncbi:MAG TPA: DUF5131 family protein, partial [Burkholderiales bacterium]|nr:DUF5131 family protein [Burkholderiales bacterium]
VGIAGVQSPPIILPCLAPPERTGVPRIDWVIVGGESGPNARPMHPDWVRAIRNQSFEAGVPFFFKQWGEHLPGEGKVGDSSIQWQDGRREYWSDHMDIKFADCHMPSGKDRYVIANRIGKKTAGRTLDGRTHDEYPA